MKDTAVKFLIDEISCRFIISEELRIAMYKAIEMEKEQIIDALQEFLDITLADELCEQYYKETFKTK